MALTGPVEIKFFEGTSRKMAKTSAVADTIYAGSVLSVAAAGGVTNTPADVLTSAGLAAETKTVAIGDTLQVWYAGIAFIPNAAAALTDEGVMLYVDQSAASNDPSVGLVVSAQSAHDYPFGRIVRASVGVGWYVDLADRAISQVAP